MDSKRRRPRLSLDLLKGFQAAARHLSFTRAAQELSLTQSAISREIKRLVEQLGQQLCSRERGANSIGLRADSLHQAPLRFDLACYAMAEPFRPGADDLHARFG
jgi:IS30 family transposase